MLPFVNLASVALVGRLKYVTTIRFREA